MPTLQTVEAFDAKHADALRQALLEVHRAVLDCERRAYEKVHGRQSDAEYLQIVAYDEAYRWLSPLSGLIVALDEGLEETSDKAQFVRAAADEARKLLQRDPDPDIAFSQRYAPLIDASPDIALAHGRMQAVLRRLR